MVIDQFHVKGIAVFKTKNNAPVGADGHRCLKLLIINDYCKVAIVTCQQWKAPLPSLTLIPAMMKVVPYPNSALPHLGGRSKLASWNIGWFSKLVESFASPAWSP